MDIVTAITAMKVELEQDLLVDSCLNVLTIYFSEEEGSSFYFVTAAFAVVAVTFQVSVVLRRSYLVVGVGLQMH